MNKNYLILLTLTVLFFSFGLTFGKTDRNIELAKQTNKAVFTQLSPAEFYKKQCAYCHESEGLIAPDMKEIKKVYLEKYPQESLFVKAMLDFVKHPTKEKALYKKGLENYTLMPKMPFKEEDLKGVIDYIYKNI